MKPGIAACLTFVLHFVNSRHEKDSACFDRMSGAFGFVRFL
jgi:hypothetical protein